MHRIAVIATPPVTVFDLSIPEMLFGAAEVDAAPGYEVVVCAADPGIIAGTYSIGVTVRHGLDAVDGADTVMVTGSGSRDGADPRVLAVLRHAASAGRRIASICTGAFTLAQAGLLDGRGATTYWVYSEELSRRFPTVEVQPDVLYVEDGRILTSAGLSAGIDLCLHMIRADYGAAVANAVARLAVFAPVRPGGQAQFIDSPLPAERGTSLAETREWALSRLHEPLTLSDLASHARISVRTLTRRFHAETGLSPLQWLLHQRLQRARELLETTMLPMDQVAGHSGLGSADSLRRHLVGRVGLTPSAYRATFTRSSAPSAATGDRRLDGV
ncbi:helix-turn-helix domain-containing protein [Streptosporangium sp. NBC_01639]|uniref:GlxA family transcriptional regulator n=1 Tax=Streptosporangium sp. NBC_01639 TaxID=2975948 RepID=UPI00386E4C66|nr:helix-turn-helix domain-containing protein [Streptosporangium sp. NBC_01639]